MAKGRMLLALVVVFVIVVIAAVGWEFSQRIGRNDILLQEAKLLLASRSWWYQQGTNASVELPSYTVVGGRRGTVVLVNRELTIEGKEHLAELGWTNSCLGAGMLIVTKDNLFLWQGPDGTNRRLNIPHFKAIPIWWYLTTP
jgi:hypothetical protein